MRKDKLQSRFLGAVWRYVCFFLLVAFVTSCCMSLFLSALAQSTGIVFTAENLNTAAKLTFANVFLISLIFSIIDAIRRKYTVDRPVKRIVEGAEKITRGDFSARIKGSVGPLGDDTFDEIAECFNKMARELEGVETLREDFVSNVSHEMKTPLAVMNNYGKLLQAPELSDESRIEYAEKITDTSRNMAEMISNILKLNRLENQEIFPKNSEFDLGEQLCESLLQYENVWERSGINIDADIADGVIIDADRELLGIVWSNLLSNAFKFTSSGGTVSVSLSFDGEYAEVRVADTGCGMSPEVGARIFEKFYQGDSSRSSKGNGLGLSLVRRIADILHADISVESTVGVGTTFTVRLSVGAR